MNNLKFKLFFLSFLLFSINLLGQLDKSAYYSYGEQMYVEVYQMPYFKVDSCKAIIYFKVINDGLSTQKYQKNNPLSKYFAVPSIDFIFKDSDGIIRKRVESNDTIFIESYEKTISKKDFITGYKTVILKKGKYKFNAIANNLNAKRNSNQKYDFNAVYNFTNNEITEPIFCNYSNLNFIDEIKPFVNARSVPFTSNGARVLMPVSYTNKLATYIYICKKEKAEEDENNWKNEILFSSSIKLRPNSIIDNKLDSKSNLILNIANTSENLGVLDFELPPEKLVPGRYEMRVFIEGNKDTAKFSFNVTWDDKPLTLKKIDYAIESMYYILTDEEYQIMNDGSKNEIYNKFYKYWTSKDPTPETPYNEAFNQYFNRVDYSFFNYQSISEKDGSKSDRGKIYILYGEPNKISEVSEDKKNIIIWSYPKIKKQFKFEMISAGIYKLIKILDT